MMGPVSGGIIRDERRNEERGRRHTVGGESRNTTVEVMEGKWRVYQKNGKIGCRQRWMCIFMTQAVSQKCCVYFLSWLIFHEFLLFLESLTVSSFGVFFCPPHHYRCIYLQFPNGISYFYLLKLDVMYSTSHF